MNTCVMEKVKIDRDVCICNSICMVKCYKIIFSRRKSRCSTQLSIKLYLYVVQQRRSSSVLRLNQIVMGNISFTEELPVTTLDLSRHFWYFKLKCKICQVEAS